MLNLVVLVMIGLSNNHLAFITFATSVLVCEKAFNIFRFAHNYDYIGVVK